MAAMVESKAVFAGRCRSMGIPADVLAAMDAKGWGTVATFAFATSWTPGTPDDQLFRDDVLVPLLGSATHVTAPAVRLLYFECFTLLAADIRSRIERGPDEAPRKLAAPERAARFRTLEIVLRGSLERAARTCPQLDRHVCGNL